MSAPTPVVRSIRFQPTGAWIDLLIDGDEHLLTVASTAPGRWRAWIFGGSVAPLCFGQVTAQPSPGHDGPAVRVEWDWRGRGEPPAWFGQLDAGTVATAIAAVAAPRTSTLVADIGVGAPNRNEDYVSLPFRLADDRYVVALSATHTTHTTGWSLVLSSGVVASPSPGRPLGLTAICRGTIDGPAPEDDHDADLDWATITAAIRAWLEPRVPIAASADVRRGFDDTTWITTVPAEGIRMEGAWELAVELDAVESAAMSPRLRRWLGDRLGPDTAARMALAAVRHQRGARRSR